LINNIKQLLLKLKGVVFYKNIVKYFLVSSSGKIKSAYSLTEFVIRLTYLEAEKKLLWEVTKKGEGQYYFPLKAILE